MEPRRGTKANPFEVDEKVRTRYFRGAAPEKERIGVVEEVDCWKGAMALRNAQNRYKVRWLHMEPPFNSEWMTCRGLDSLGLQLNIECPSCGSNPDVDCICKPGG